MERIPARMPTPLHYTGNRGSGVDHIMGTILFSVLNGHWRYAHINSVRGDGIKPDLLELRDLHAITERWTVDQRWSLLLNRLLRRWLGGKWLPRLPEEAELLLSG